MYGGFWFVYIFEFHRRLLFGCMLSALRSFSRAVYVSPLAGQTNGQGTWRAGVNHVQNGAKRRNVGRDQQELRTVVAATAQGPRAKVPVRRVLLGHGYGGCQNRDKRIFLLFFRATSRKTNVIDSTCPGRPTLETHTSFFPAYISSFLNVSI